MNARLRLPFSRLSCALSVCVGALAAQQKEPESGLVAVHQARLDARSGVVVLNVAAHPDDESSRTNTMLRRKHGMHIVQLKAGSEHRRMYQGQAQSLIAREAWSVRGHWRRQPYPSLGLDEHGEVITKLIWIASYTKGDGAPSTEPKVISVR